MRSLLEKAIVHLLNGDQGKAESLFHKFMVERAREIHESLRQNEDVQLAEGWDSEISEEEYFDDLDSKDDLGGVEDGGDGEGIAPDMGAEPSMGAEAPMGDDAGLDGDIEGDGIDDVVDDEGMAPEGGDLEDKLDDIGAKMDELSAEFDRLMAEFGGGDAEEGLPSDDEELPNDFGGDETDMDAPMDDESMGDELGGDDDLAGRMEDDMADEHQPEHEMAEDFEGIEEEAEEEVSEDDEMMEDITESVLAELDKVAATPNSHKEIGSAGKTISDGDHDMLPHHPAKDRVNQAKPYMVKGGDNNSYERETPPSSKKVTSRRNNDAGVKKLKTVPPKGDASSILHTDYAGSRPTTKSITSGKPSK